MRSIVGILVVTAFLAGCTDDSSTRTLNPLRVAPTLYMKGKPISEQAFGRARIAVGMSKEEVLEQIELSRRQYQPLQDDGSTERYIAKPSDETVWSNEWLLTCPNRNSHVLGGGSGIILRLNFRDGKVVGIVRLPWLAG